MTLFRLILLTMVGCLVTTPGEGQTRGSWTIGLEGVVVSPKDDRGEMILPGGEASYGVEGEGAGFGFSLGYRLSERIELELAASLVDLDTELRTTGATGARTQSASFELYLTGIRWHLFPRRTWDVSAGVFLAQSKLDDLIFLTEAGEEKFTFDDDYGFGVTIGLDWPIGGGGWILGGELRYLTAILESDSDAADVDLDPLILSVGVGYRFGGH